MRFHGGEPESERESGGSGGTADRLARKAEWERNYRGTVRVCHNSLEND